MAVDKEEGVLEKVGEFVTQKPEDRAYEDEGGNSEVPVEQRTDDPKADANRYAREQGDEPPYPDHQETPPERDVEGVVVDDDGQAL